MNLFDLLPWWLWLTGSLGIVGTILLIVLAPTVAGVIGKLLGNLLSALLETRAGVGLVVGAAMGAIGWFGGGFYAERQCNEAAVRAEYEQKLAAAKIETELVKRDLDAARTSAQFDTTASAWITSADAVRQETIRENTPDPKADCHRLGSAGVKLLRAVGPD